jgi:hypothetical protein
MLEALQKVARNLDAAIVLADNVSLQETVQI